MLGKHQIYLGENRPLLSHEDKIVCTRTRDGAYICNLFASNDEDIEWGVESQKTLNLASIVLGYMVESKLIPPMGVDLIAPDFVRDILVSMPKAGGVLPVLEVVLWVEYTYLWQYVSHEDQEAVSC